MKYSGIGGQAVIEGIMMMNRNDYAVAVRRPDGEIEIKKDKYESITTKAKILSLPFIRGVFRFADSMILGIPPAFLKMMRKKNRVDLKNFWTAFSEKNWKALLCQLLWYFLLFWQSGSL